MTLTVKLNICFTSQRWACPNMLCFWNKLPSIQLSLFQQRHLHPSTHHNCGLTVHYTQPSFQLEPQQGLKFNLQEKKDLKPEKGIWNLKKWTFFPVRAKERDLTGNMAFPQWPLEVVQHREWWGWVVPGCIFMCLLCRSIKCIWRSIILSHYVLRDPCKPC